MIMRRLKYSLMHDMQYVSCFLCTSQHCYPAQRVEPVAIHL